MGMLDQAALQQAKKAQGETNDRLEALIAEQRQMVAEQRRTNELLAQLIHLLTPQAAAPVTATWGNRQQ